MACMEYECTQCEYFNITNKLLTCCPKCGAPLISTFDEAGDHD